MRQHALLSRFAPFIEQGRFGRVVGAAHLVAARLQPSFYPWGEGWIDLVFSRDGEFALVPFVQIDPPMVYVREASPFIWPSWLPLDDLAVAGVEALLEPWLLAQTLLGSLDQEIIGFFTDDVQARETFAAARAARFLCATLADDLLTDVAPYVYAQRFAAGKRVGISSADGALGASLLARIANTVHADLGEAQRNALAQTWYGIGIYGAIPHATFDVEISAAASNGASASIALESPPEGATEVSFARPVFPLLACSFDAADADPVRHFSVRAREPILRTNRLTSAPVIGGSEGRIAIVIRDDGLVAPEADVDQARALAEALRAQGFDARLVAASAARAQECDLIHLFGHRHVAQFEYILDEAKRLDIPVVATPMLDDFGNESLWGTAAVRTMLSGIRDEATQRTIEQGLAARLVLTDAESERGKPPFDERLLQKMFAQCRSAVFATHAEEVQARSRYGFSGPSRLVPCVPAPPITPEPIGALCGADEYVLVHAAVEPRANQWIAMRAAAAIGAACVLVGTVENAEYYQGLLEAGGDRVIWLPQDTLTPGQLEALYAGARIFADLSWAGHGAVRLVRAAAHGTVPAMSAALELGELWPELTGGADPGSLESATAVLRQAWMRAPAIGYQIAERTVQLCDPLRSLQAVLGAYAEAAGVKAG
ncbi:MAG: hypothetical protein WBD74_02640 [Candidatus Aquilonibacter sp.]